MSKFSQKHKDRILNNIFRQNICKNVDLGVSITLSKIINKVLATLGIRKCVFKGTFCMSELKISLQSSELKSEVAAG